MGGERKEKQNKTKPLLLSSRAAVRLQRKIPVIPKPDGRNCDASCADSGSQFNMRTSVEQVGFNIGHFPPRKL